MRWILVAALLTALAVGGALLAAQQKPAEEDVDEFVPTEKVPAGSAVAFPVDI